MMGMEPGPDGKDWELCFGCWIQGTAMKKPANTLEQRAARK